MHDPALISVIVPCYNQGHFLEETLYSILNQTYHFWECIIVDDGSSDNTKNISILWTSRDRRFSYIYKKNGGLSSARNKGIQHAKGKYILPLDSDDKIHKSFLEKVIQVFEANNNLELVCCRIQLFGVKNKELILPNYSYKTLLLQNCFVASSVFKKSSWNRLGGYDEQLQSFEDWEFWIRLLRKNGQVHHIPEILFMYRKHKESSLSNRFYKDRGFYNSLYDYVYKKHIDVYMEVFPNIILIYQDYLKLKAFNEKIKNTTLFQLYIKVNSVLNKITSMLQHIK